MHPLKPIAYYLWDLHWIFKINFIHFLYLIIGGAIIFCTTPSMTLKECIVFRIGAVIISLIFFCISDSFDRGLDNYKYKRYIKEFGVGEVSRLYLSHKQYNIAEKVFWMIYYSPFLGLPEVFWRILL